MVNIYDYASCHVVLLLELVTDNVEFPFLSQFSGSCYFEVLVYKNWNSPLDHHIEGWILRVVRCMCALVAEVIVIFVHC